VSYPTVADWSSASRSFDVLAGYRGKRYTLTGAGEATSLRATVSSGSLFRVLDVPAARGSALSPADDAGAPVAVLGDEAWRTLFGADAGIIGKTVYLNRVAFTIVGVMPPGFQFPTGVDRVDLYTTVAGDLQADRRQAERTYPRDLQVVARLRPGVTLSQARAEMSAIVAAGTRDRAGQSVDPLGLVVPLAADVTGALVSPLTILAWAVACVLVIACSTVAILSLIRVVSRRGELATRLALGATRARLARQLLAEGLLVAIAGGVAGALLAYLGAAPLLRAAGTSIASAARSQFDARVLLITLAVSVVVAIVSAAIPALEAASTRWPRFAGPIAFAGHRSTAPAARGLLVTVEVAVTVALVAACITLLRGYLALSRVDPGFDAKGVLTFRIDLSDALYSPRQQVDFFEHVRQDVRGLPGVKAAAFTALLPFGDLRFTIRLDTPSGGAGDVRQTPAEVHLVSPGFFEAMGIPLDEGRDFGAADVAGHPRVAIVSRSLAARCFPGQNPIGRLVKAGIGPAGATDPMVQVVGVVGDVRNGSLATPTDPQLYLPYSQAPLAASTTFTTRLRGTDSSQVLAAIRQRVRALNAAVPIVAVRPLEDYLYGSLARPRFGALLVGVFACAAVFLAAAGLYAVVSYSAVRRRREFSIRRALGATERAIAWMVVRQGLLVVVPGLVAGLAGAIAADRVLSGALFGVRPSRPATLLLSAVAAAAIALVSTWRPARAAAGDDLRSTLQGDV
jgi:predicted permease